MQGPRQSSYVGQRGEERRWLTKVSGSLERYPRLLIDVDVFKGPKSSVHTHLNYLVIVSPPFIPNSATPSATVRNFIARTPLPERTDVSKVTVFDLENKFVAYSGTFVEGVRDVISEWGHIYVLTNDGKVR